MDYGREAGFGGGNVVQVLSGNPGNGGFDNWVPGSADQVVWATEDEYGVWNEEASDDTMNSNYDGRQSQCRSGSEPPNKKSKLGDLPSANRSKAIGKMFFKTKLCCKFRAGTCPYVTNCNFAHSIEELRRPPPNWQEIVAAHEEERATSLEPREEFQIPSVGSSVFGGETQRSYKGRHCKKFYTEEGCPYGDTCTFLHDEQSKARESVAISLGPGAGGGYGSGGSTGCGGGGGSNNGSSTVNGGSNLKPSNWKTRICNKWEITGYCPFGSKCHFAHGAEELHRYVGGLGETDGSRESGIPPQDQKQQGTLLVPSKTSVDAVAVPATTASSVFHMDGYHHAGPVQAQRLLSNVKQRTGLPRPHQKWKGPDKISRIYGDWIDDIQFQ